MATSKRRISPINPQTITIHFIIVKILPNGYPKISSLLTKTFTAFMVTLTSTHSSSPSENANKNRSALLPNSPTDHPALNAPVKVIVIRYHSRTYLTSEKSILNTQLLPSNIHQYRSPISQYVARASSCAHHKQTMLATYAQNVNNKYDDVLYHIYNFPCNLFQIHTKELPFPCTAPGACNEKQQ